MLINKFIKAYQENPVDYSPDKDCPTCPFCNARFATRKEIRPDVKCGVCQGSAKQAIAACGVVEAELERVVKRKDITRLDELGDILRGYWQFEFRRRKRFLQNKATEAE